MSLTNLEHLGDGCYVGWDGFHVVLMANSHDNPTDIVCLDPDVWKRLQDWFLKLQTKASER